MEDLKNEIQRKKALLVKVASIHDFNFNHPEVMRVSEQLDVLIIQAMKIKMKVNSIQGSQASSGDAHLK